MTEHSNPPDQNNAPEAAADQLPAVAEAPAIPELPPAACALRLAELFPAVFTPGAPKPLKLRIQADVQQRAPGIFTKKSLSIFLHRHTTSTAYIKALLNSPQRFDLDGQPAGEIAAEHREAASAELERRRASHEARRAAERDAQREVQHKALDEARRARAAEDDQRRERDALIRAYETSTLTRANFCALKGLSEAELAALLALPRQAPAPQRHDPRAAEREARPAHRGPTHQRSPSAPKPGR